jgi:hypothetical protein
MEAADSFPCLLLLSQFLLCYWRRGPVPWDGGESARRKQETHGEKKSEKKIF